MIAIDTNVLLRYLLHDDLNQAEAAKQLINGHPEVLLTDVVLVETLWTLSGKRYGLPKKDLLAVLESLIAEFCFEDKFAVWAAFNDYRNTKAAGFADALIVNKAKRIAKQKAQSLLGTYTFDAAAQQLDGMLPL